MNTKVTRIVLNREITTSTGLSVKSFRLKGEPVRPGHSSEIEFDDLQERAHGVVVAAPKILISLPWTSVAYFDLVELSAEEVKANVQAFQEKYAEITGQMQTAIDRGIADSQKAPRAADVKPIQEMQQKRTRRGGAAR